MNKGHTYAILAAIATAAAILINKVALAIVPPIAFGAYRSLIVVLGLLIVNSFFIKDKKIVLKRSDIMYLVVSGVLCTVSVITVLYGQKLTTAVNTGFLLNVSPLFVVLLAPFYVGEKIKKEHLYSLALMLIGAYLILTGGSIAFFIGDLLIIATAVGNAVSNLLQRKALFKVPTTIAAYVNNCVMMTLLFLILLVQGFVIPSFDQLFWIVLAGLTLIVFWVAFFKSMKTIGANNTALYQYLSPVFVGLGAVFLLGEQMNLIRLAGGAAILLGACLIPRE